MKRYHQKCLLQTSPQLGEGQQDQWFCLPNMFNQGNIDRLNADALVISDAISLERSQIWRAQPPNTLQFDLALGSEEVAKFRAERPIKDAHTLHVEQS